MDKIFKIVEEEKAETKFDEEQVSQQHNIAKIAIAATTNKLKQEKKNFINEADLLLIEQFGEIKSYHSEFYTLSLRQPI